MEVVGRGEKWEPPGKAELERGVVLSKQMCAG